MTKIKLHLVCSIAIIFGNFLSFKMTFDVRRKNVSVQKNRMGNNFIVICVQHIIFHKCTICFVCEGEKRNEENGKFLLCGNNMCFVTEIFDMVSANGLIVQYNLLLMTINEKNKQNVSESTVEMKIDEWSIKMATIFNYMSTTSLEWRKKYAFHTLTQSFSLFRMHHAESNNKFTSKKHHWANG